MLSPLAPVPAGSRADLLGKLRPGIDGLVIAAGRRHHGVFLPAVWDELTEPSVFLDHLLLKAGLDPRSWPPGVRAWLFTAEKFGRQSGAQPSPFRAA